MFVTLLPHSQLIPHRLTFFFLSEVFISLKYILQAVANETSESIGVTLVEVNPSPVYDRLTASLDINYIFVPTELAAMTGLIAL